MVERRRRVEGHWPYVICDGIAITMKDIARGAGASAQTGSTVSFTSVSEETFQYKTLQMFSDSVRKAASDCNESIVDMKVWLQSVKSGCKMEYMLQL